MRCFPSKQSQSGFTLVEVLVLIAVLVFLFLMLLPSTSTGGRPRAQRIRCVVNLKQIGLAESGWQNDHANKFSFQLPQTNGGTREFTSGDIVWRHFQLLSNRLGDPKFLICPADDFRSVAATNFDSINNSNVSYFVGLDSTPTNPQGILCGDWNITNGAPMQNGILELATNQPAGWTGENHKKVGNLLLADGSVQQVSITGLRLAVENSGVFTNHFQMPILEP